MRKYKIIIRKEEHTSRCQYVVELQKMGYRLTLMRSAPNQRHTTDAFAKDLSEFAGIKIVDETGEKK